jgi:hypothetical protein
VGGSSAIGDIRRLVRPRLTNQIGTQSIALLIPRGNITATEQSTALWRAPCKDLGDEVNGPKPASHGYNLPLTNRQGSL